MLPSVLDPQTTSPGERELFVRLQRDPRTADWIVLHSLDISHHVRAVSGEADFLILVPSKGVLALEVKACRTLRRANGVWYYGERDKGDSRGPFKQASEAMHSIRGRVARHPELRNVPFWSAVVFPYIRFDERSDEWHSWQVIDNRQFHAKPFSDLVVAVLDSARTFLAGQEGARWFHPDAAQPTARQCEVIAKLLRPDFEVAQTPSQQREEREAELRTFTEEQFAALDAMQTNPRVVFEGAAGTGKTVLAIEAARRAAASGKRVLFICFNAMLGEWLRQQTQSLGPAVTTRTLHSYMLQAASVTVDRSRHAFWETELPELALARLLDDESFVPFDELVIDEAQDILRDAYIDVLDLSVIGGIAAGTWRLFGDFERQAIYDTATLPLREFCAQRGGSPARFTLSANCRNTPRIVELIRVLSSLPDAYTKVLRPDSGVEPRIHFYDGDEEETELLGEVLADFYSGGLAARDIAVLSPLASGSCAARVSAPAWVDRLAPARESAVDQIPYTTIHAFKGLEAAGVVVTDIASVNGAAAESLFYTAVTRATDRLAILVAESARTDLRRLVEAPAEARA